MNFKITRLLIPNMCDQHLEDATPRRISGQPLVSLHLLKRAFFAVHQAYIFVLTICWNRYIIKSQISKYLCGTHPGESVGKWRVWLPMLSVEPHLRQSTPSSHTYKLTDQPWLMLSNRSESISFPGMFVCFMDLSLSVD